MGRIRDILKRRIILPCGEGRDGTEVICTVPRNMDWKLLDIDDVANVMFFLAQILPLRYAMSTSLRFRYLPHKSLSLSSSNNLSFPLVFKLVLMCQLCLCCREGAARKGFTIVMDFQGVGWRNIDIAKQRTIMHAISRTSTVRICGAALFPSPFSFFLYERFFLRLLAVHRLFMNGITHSAASQAFTSSTRTCYSPS